MRRHIAVGFTVVLGLGVLTGCASTTGPAGAAPSAGSSISGGNIATSAAPPSGSPVPQPTGTATHTGPPVTYPTPSGDGVTTLHGEITIGVEPSCKLLSDDKVEYLLLSNDTTTLVVGESVIVTGSVEHGVMTHCQQGIPFAVTSINQVATPQ